MKRTRAWNLAKGGLSILVLAAMIALSGCAITLPRLDEVKDSHLNGHYILAHEDGYAISAMGPASRPELHPPKDTEDIEGRVLAGIDMHAKRLWPSSETRGPVAQPPLHILIFVHGGLNGYKADFERMREMIAEPCSPEAKPQRLFVSRDCGKARTSYYPIFVNWNSGLVDSIFDDLFFIRFGRRSWEYGWFTWPFVLAARVAEGIFAAPNGWMANTRTFWEGDPTGLDVTEGIVMAPVRGLSTPVLTAFGTSAWQIMRRRADLVTADRLEPSQELAARPQVRRRGAARTLFRMLDERIEACPSGQGSCWKFGPQGKGGPAGPVEISLVGHSMGAIVLNRLLTTPHRLPIRRIIYLAPAANMEEIEGLVRPYIERPPDTRGARYPEFWTFTLRRHDEALERDLRTFILPRGTLLVWIDNFFEPVVEPGDNRFGRFKSHLDYYGREGEDDPRERKSFLTVCRWTSTSPSRPVRHDEIDNRRYLEGILWRVGSEAFQTDPAVTPIEVACRRQ